MNIIIKKIGLIIYALLLSIPIYAYDFEVDGLYYDVTSFTDMTCAITYGENNYKGDFIIPSEVTYNSRNLKVTSIGSKAFFGCSSLTSVTIPNSVTSIGSYAFSSCSSLTSVTIPNSVTSIGYGAFSDCSSLISVTIPNSVTSIVDNTFSYCNSLTSVTIPNSVTSIGYGAFFDCSSLRSVTIPNSVTSIGSYAFDGCRSLENIQLSNNLMYISNKLFNGCENLKSLDIPGSVKYIEQYYISPSFPTFGECTSLTKLSLRQGFQPLEVGYRNSSTHNFVRGEWETWTETIKELYIDRELEQDIPVPNLVKLELGESVKVVQVSSIPKIESFNTIYSYSKEPPTLPTMSNKQYLNMIVKVPAEALEAYKAADSWKNFWNLSALDPGESGINEIKTASSPIIIGRYDINGNRVDENYNGLTIVKFSDGSSRKFIHSPR